MALKQTLVMCVKFSKFDYDIRLSHPLGAAVARLPKRSVASDGGGEGWRASSWWA